MNYRLVCKQLGLLLLVLSLAMGGVALLEWGLWRQGGASELLGMQALGLAALLGVGLGGACWLVGRGTDLSGMGRRDAMLLVAMTWLLGAAIAALPYYLWAHLHGHHASRHVFEGWSACYFEAMSGLTTTGGTVLAEIESLPGSLLLWRATTHWLGGLGIVVLFVAVLPTLGVGDRRLVQAEAASQPQQGVRPRIKETARVLWGIYLLLTVLAIGALWFCGLSVFDAVCYGFSAISTGGFANHNASLGFYHDLWTVDAVILLCMLLGSINFGLYFHLVRRRWRQVVRDTELRVYGGMLLLATGVIAASLWGRPVVLTQGETLEVVGATEALRLAGVQAVSLQSTTGFATADYDRWTFPAQAVLMVLLLVGGCGGSTSGGIKVFRVVLVLRILWAEIERVYRPSVVRTIRIGQGVVDANLKLGTLVFVLSLAVLFLLGAVVLRLLEPAETMDFATAASASAACLMNVGPGLGAVGPMGNYGVLSAPSQWLMSLWMALGRLEMYALIVLLYPRFWRGD